MTYKFEFSSHWTLYNNQHPLIPPCPIRRKEIWKSGMFNRHKATGFHVPFAKEAV